MDAENKSNVIIYNDGELELNISLYDESIWLTQKQLSELFEVTKQNVSLHINRIFEEKELDKNATVKFYLIVQKEGSRRVERNLEHYNLDMIISIGYRINSIKATKFRQWATSVLKSYITNGYVINSEKITHQRFKELEDDVVVLKSHVNQLSHAQEIKILSEGIYFDGQIFDAHNFVSDLVRSAKNTIVLIDNYVDDSTLLLFSKNQNIEVTIYTDTLTKSMKLDLEKYNKQYKNIIECSEQLTN